MVSYVPNAHSGISGALISILYEPPNNAASVISTEKHKMFSRSRYSAFSSDRSVIIVKQHSFQSSFGA